MSSDGVVNKAQTKKTRVKLVKMVRNGILADVHPDEVESYKKVGWQNFE